MPGFWELLQHRSVLTAVLHTEIVPIAWAFGLRRLQLPGPLLPLTGMPYDHARNVACQSLLNSDLTHLFFLDSDVIPDQPDAVLRLLRHNLPVVSGLYCRRSPPHAVPVAIKDGQWLNGFRPGSLVEVDVVGSGLLLIHRSVIEQMPPQDDRRGKRWFDWRVDMPNLPPGEAMSEDFTFCLASRRSLGVKIMVDTGVTSRHVGLAQATLGGFAPCSAVA